VWCTGHRRIQREAVSRHRERFGHARRGRGWGEFERQDLTPGVWTDGNAVLNRRSALLREGQPHHAVPDRLGITAERWREIEEACSITVIALQPDS